MCKYQCGSTLCRGDGYCWDSDSDGYDPENTAFPCPSCNSLAYLLLAKEEAESTAIFSNAYGIGSWGSGSGVTIWEAAVAIVVAENPEQAQELLNQIGRVDALRDDFKIKAFTYPAPAKSTRQAQKKPISLQN